MLAGASVMDEANRNTVVILFTISLPIYGLSSMTSHIFLERIGIFWFVFVFSQVKDNPAALLALCWYWASDGIGSKVGVRNS